MSEWGTIVDASGQSWRVRRLGVGTYVGEDGVLHIAAQELLEHFGFADTPENRRTLAEAAREMVAREFPGVRVEDRTA